MPRILAFISPIFACAALLSVATSATAAETFDAAKFARAQAAGRSVLVEISATWCSVCAQQKPIVHALEAANPALLVLEVDFDSAKDDVRRFKAQYQSTLVMFKGATETARSVGQTDPAAIKALVETGL